MNALPVCSFGDTIRSGTNSGGLTNIVTAVDRRFGDGTRVSHCTIPC